MTFVEFSFWLGLGLVGWSYFGYPILLLFIRYLRPVRRRMRESDSIPRVSFIISAFNEEDVIEEKLENSLALDYPSEHLEIIVISDESTDRTDEIVARYADQGVRLFRQIPREGKSAGLTKFVPEATGEFVVFSDANAIYERSAVRNLVNRFCDETIGYVVGRQLYWDDENETAQSESLYWKYETWLKALESDAGGVVGGDGAIMAIRASLFEPLRADDINDFYLPLRMVSRGYRGIYATDAECYEKTAADFGGEFRRKVRIVNRSVRAVTRAASALNPFRVGFHAIQLLSHKVLRWLAPCFLIMALAANIVLALDGRLVYQVLAIGHLGFYGLALLRTVPGLGSLKIVYICYYFCLINTAAALGILSFIGGKTFATWAPQRS